MAAAVGSHGLRYGWARRPFAWPCFAPTADRSPFPTFRLRALRVVEVGWVGTLQMAHTIPEPACRVPTHHPQLSRRVWHGCGRWQPWPASRMGATAVRVAMFRPDG